MCVLDRSPDLLLSATEEDRYDWEEQDKDSETSEAAAMEAETAVTTPASVLIEAEAGSVVTSDATAAAPAAAVATVSDVTAAGDVIASGGGETVVA